MTKGSKMSDKQKNNVSEGLKRFFETTPHPWNKGLKYGKHNEPAAKRFRKDKDYYKKELKKNSERSHEKKYDIKRYDEIKKQKEFYDKITGKGRKPKKWSVEENIFLEENYKTLSYLQLCSEMQRSWNSISHRLNRLKLRKYNKWKKL